MSTMTRQHTIGPVLLMIGAMIFAVICSQMAGLSSIPDGASRQSATVSANVSDPRRLATVSANVSAPMLTATERQSAETLAGLMAPSGQVTVHIPGVGPTTWGRHAESRHGPDAWKAIAAAAACGERCLFRCPNGKVYSTGWLDAGHSFLVVLAETTGVTAFMSTHDLSYRPIEEGCSSVNGRLAGHDGFGPGMAY